MCIFSLLCKCMYVCMYQVMQVCDTLEKRADELGRLLLRKPDPTKTCMNINIHTYIHTYIHAYSFPLPWFPHDSLEQFAAFQHLHHDVNVVLAFIETLHTKQIVCMYVCMYICMYVCMCPLTSILIMFGWFTSFSTAISVRRRPGSHSVYVYIYVCM